MSEAFITPWWQAMLLPEKWNVCGVEVRSISVWHLYMLENIRNAYVVGGAHDQDAAAGLLLICSRDMAEGRNLYLLPRERGRALANIHKVIKPIPWPEMNAACADYVSACLRVPRHKEIAPARESVRLLAAPYQWPIVLCLCNHYQLTTDQAWNHPYAPARCMYDTYRETEKDDDTLFREDQERRKDEYAEKNPEKQ